MKNFLRKQNKDYCFKLLALFVSICSCQILEIQVSVQMASADVIASWHRPIVQSNANCRSKDLLVTFRRRSSNDHGIAQRAAYTSFLNKCKQKHGTDG